MTPATSCQTCGRTLNGSLCCPDCGTPVEPDGSAAGPGPLPPEADAPDAAPISVGVPPVGPGPLPPAVPAAPRGGAVPPAEPPAVPDRRRRGGPLAKGAAAAVLVAALACGGFLVFAPAGEQAGGTPGTRRTEQPRTDRPSDSAPTPSGTPSPRIAGSDPRPAPSTKTAEPSPPPPSPTPPAPTPAVPEPAPTTPRPSFSWPSSWPTPSRCAEIPWC
ncbi:hypothetical protein E4198_17900 [Streptomyces sp. RKND-216]|uniref:hypothetical protein n=1 Tax=Streptomyces sp. RKND-216 TaxID=2562581 RepID=UPI00109E30FA|nr:hypothetical protein [Streptomyces sp. RKND-216]THA26310.1 hypothetical protein E4198_17900 [Streptomyces sp. RKND-216]